MAKITKRDVERQRGHQQEHPDDKAARIRCEVAAAKIIDAFTAKHQKKLVALVQTWSDADAQAQLEQLRELFWTSIEPE